jgi:hypothetical protein
MWSMQSGWFDVAVMMSVFAVGNICSGTSMLMTASPLVNDPVPFGLAGNGKDR